MKLFKKMFRCTEMGALVTCGRVKDGVVTLTETVDSYAKSEAEDAAKNVIVVKA